MLESHEQVRKLSTSRIGEPEQSPCPAPQADGEKSNPSEATLLQLQLKPQKCSLLSLLEYTNPPPFFQPHVPPQAS